MLRGPTRGASLTEAGMRRVFRTQGGPFPMETTYTWTPTAEDGTHMTLRNHGEPGAPLQDGGAADGARDATRQPQGPRRAQGEGRQSPVSIAMMTGEVGLSVQNTRRVGGRYNRRRPKDRARGHGRAPVARKPPCDASL
jgi:hypothetical protein